MRKRNTIERHKLDIHTVPRDKAVMYTIEPCLIDRTLLEISYGEAEPEAEAQEEISI